jgi:hypothetical protein
MSVIIKFPNGSDWRANNFAFGRLLVRYAAFFPEEKHMQYELESARAAGLIVLKSGDSQSRQMVEALRKVAERAIAELAGKGECVVDEGPAGVQDALQHYRRLLELTGQALM